MYLFFFWQDLNFGNLFLLFLDEGVENELQIFDDLSGDLLVGFGVVGPRFDCVVVKESQVSQVQLSVSCHC